MAQKIEFSLVLKRSPGEATGAAAVIMAFTPDHIDLIIEALLAALGIEKLVIRKKDE